MKRFFCLFLALLTAFFSAACKNETKKTEVQERKEVDENGIITIYSLKDDTLCPILTDNEANRQMLGIVYESLVHLTDSMEPQGVLAENWSRKNDNSLWTVNLRTDVKWHSGEYFTADDVVYTINQIKANRSSIYSDNVEMIKEVSESGNTVLITLTEPCPTFINLLTFPIIKKTEETIDRETFLPCGTGAFYFSGQAKGVQYRLLRNDEWWGGKALLAEIRVKLLPDSDTVEYSFASGDIDLADTGWGQERAKDSAAARGVSCALTVYDFIGINHNNSVLAGKEVRKALNLALRRDKVINDIFAGHAVSANAPIRDDWYVNSVNGEYRSDTVAAENILLKNGWKKDNGVYSKKTSRGKQSLEIELIVNKENSTRVNIAENIKADMAKAGISIIVVPLEFEEYSKRINDGKYELFVGSVMVSDSMDMSFFLGKGNMFGFEDEETERILSDIKLSDSREKLTENYGKLKNSFVSEMPIVGICFENFDMLYSKRVKGELDSSPSNIYFGIQNLYTEK